MDHVFDSEESSSGCESGWTLYLDHSCKHAFAAHDQHNQEQHDHEHDEYVEDDDDMSMVSDASSGPPHFQEHQEQDEDDEYNNNNNINGGLCDPMMFGSRKRRRVLEQTSLLGHRHLQDLPVTLDDTASSPFFSFCNKDLKVCTKEGLMEDDNRFDYSQGHSTTYFEMV